MGMTGFAREAGEADWGRWVWEGKSVNGRGLDIRLNLPNGLDTLEQKIRTAAAKRFARGNLQIVLRLDFSAAVKSLAVNMSALEALMAAYEQAEGAMATGPALAQLMTIKGVVETESGSGQALFEDKSVIETLMKGCEAMLDGLAASRQREGDTLKLLLESQLSEIAAHTTKAMSFADEQKQGIAERYRARLKEFDTESAVTEERLVSEIAVLAAKADVTEELDRLHAHVQTGYDLLGQDNAIGRNLGFLAQELNREANTLCSKSSSLDLTNTGLALKSVIDQFKEQAANVE